MNRKSFLRKLTVWATVFAMLLPFFSKTDSIKVFAADSYTNLLIDNFEDGMIPGTQTAAVTIADKSAYGGVYSNGACGFGRMADIEYGTKQTETTTVKYMRSFENNVPAGTANAYMEIEFDLGIYKKTMAQMTMNFKSDGAQIGYLRWNTQGGALDVHYNAANVSQKTAVTSERAKSSSATASNKIDHIKIVFQITDAGGNPVNIFKSFKINDTLISSESGVAFSVSSAINGFDLTVNPPRAGWSACDAGLNLDNLVITRYMSSDGTSPAPERYNLLKKIAEKYSEVTDAKNTEKIGESDYNELMGIVDNAVSVYASGISKDSFSSAAESLDEISDTIAEIVNRPIGSGDGYAVLVMDNFEDGAIPGTQTAAVTIAEENEYSDNYSNGAYGFRRVLDIGYGTKQTATQSVKYSRSFTNSVPAGVANAYLELEFDLGIYKKTMSQINFNLKSNNTSVGYLRWNSQGGALDVYSSGSQRTAVSSDKAKSSSASGKNKIDHIKIVIQITDSSGNPVNLFKRFEINDTVVSSDSGVSFGTGSAINYFDITLNPPGAGWSACDAGVSFDNLVITRYMSEDGKSPAPQRYSLYKEIMSVVSKAENAQSSGIIDSDKFSEIAADIQSVPVNAYMTAMSSEGFASAYNKLNEIKEEIDAISYMKENNTSVYIGTPYISAENLSAVGNVTVSAPIFTLNTAAERYAAAFLYVNDGKTVGGKLLDIKTDRAIAAENSKATANVVFDLNSYSEDKSKMFVKVLVVENMNELAVRPVAVTEFSAPQYQIDSSLYSFSGDVNVSASMADSATIKTVVAVSGEAEERVSLIIMKKNKSLSEVDDRLNNVEYYGSAVTDGEGHAVFEHIPLAGTGEYSYAVCGLESGTVTGSLYYADVPEITDAFTELYSNPASLSNAGYRKALGVDSEVYTNAVRSEVDTVSVLKIVLAEQLYDASTVDRFAKSFLDKLGMLTGFKNAVSADEVGQYMRTYMNEISNYSMIRELTSKQKQFAYENIFDFRNSITSIEQMNAVIKSAAEAAAKIKPGNITTSGGSGDWGYISGGDRSKDSQSVIVNVENLFVDIADVEWARPAILEFAARGWINGKSEGSFAPFDSITREEFIKMAVNVFGLTVENAESNFEDVDKTAWYYPYISAASSMEIVNGVSDTEFGVGSYITREDIAAIIYRAAKSAGITLTADGEYIPFTDEKMISGYAYEAVVNLAKSGVLNGADGNMFIPQNAATRAEAVKMLYGIYTLRSAGLKVLTDDTESEGNIYVPQNGKERLLCELGILDADELDLSSNMTGEEFIAYALRMLGAETQKADSRLFFDVDESNRYYNEIYTAYQIGLIDVPHDGNFGAGCAVTLNNAAEIMVRALNAEHIAKEMGGYLAAAKYLNLFDGIEITDMKELTREDAVQLIFNTLNSKYVTTENGKEYKKSDKTLLETGFSVYHRQGLLEASYYGNIYGMDSERRGYVMIDDVELLFKEDLLAKDLMGCNVEFYYRKTDSGAYEVIYMYEKGNSIIEVSADDSEKYEPGGFIYYKNDVKTVLNLSDKVLTLVNGGRINLTSMGVIIPNYGKIRLIDNNGDGRYDVTFIDDCELARSVDVNVSENTIYTSSDKYKVIDLNEYDSFYIRDTKNNEIKVGDINKDMILSICGKADKSFVEIIVCSERLEIVPERVNGRKAYGHSYIEITDESGQVWRTVAAFEDLSDDNEISLGNKYVFGLAPNGNIAAVFSKEDLSEFKYGYIIRVAYDEKTEKAQLKLLSRDNGVKIYYTGTRVRRLNGAGRVTALNFVNEYDQRVQARLAIENEKRSSSAAYADYRILNEIIRFKTDKNDEIISVEFPDDVSVGNGLRQQTELERTDAHISNRYYASDKLLGGTIPIDDNTLVFNVPTRDYENEDSLYSVTSSSKLSNHYYYPQAVSYTYDNDIYAEVVVIPSRTSFTNTQSGYMLVNSIYNVYDEKSGENKTAIDGLVQGTMTTLYVAGTCDLTYTSATGDTYAIDEGDMIKYNTNILGEMSFTKVLFDNDRKVVINNNNAEENGTNVIWGGQAYVFGKVERIYDGKYFTFSPRNYTGSAYVKPGNNGYDLMMYYYPVSASTQIYRFDNASHKSTKAEKISIYDVPNLYNDPRSTADAVVVSYEAETNFLIVYEY